MSGQRELVNFETIRDYCLYCVHSFANYEWTGVDQILVHYRKIRGGIGRQWDGNIIFILVVG